MSGGGTVRRAIPAEEALRRLLAVAKPTGPERVPLHEAFGRRAAEDIASGEPVPHFRRAGMDGYAVASGDTLTAKTDAPAALRVIGTIACGDRPSFELQPGSAARIMTGAMLPGGADAVIMQEAVETAEGGGVVRVRRPAALGLNVSEIGSDVAEGAIVVRRGSRIGAAEIALLTAVGWTEVLVPRRPSVAIIPTGTELLPAGAPLSPGKVRNSNGAMLAAQTASAGAAAVLYDPQPDVEASIAAAIEDALAACDLVVTTGGVSVGDFDLMPSLLRAGGGEPLFDKVMMRPGSVTSAAVRGGKTLLALSGNPGACFAGFELFGRPVLEALQGAPDPGPRTMEATLSAPFRKSNAYPRYVRGRWWSEGGRLLAAASEGDRSSRLLPGAGAGCFVVIPPGDGLPEGAAVTILPLQA